MSAFPRDPEHFYRWVRQHHDPQAQPQDFVPRRVYGDYVEGLLRTAAEYPANARLVRRAGGRGRHRPARRPVRGAPRRRAQADRRPRRRARDRRPGRAPTGHRTGWPRRGRLARPVDRRAARRRPAAGRHRPDHGRRRDRGGPARAARCTRSSRHDAGARAHRAADDPARAAAARHHPAAAPSTSCARPCDAHVERTVEETGDWRAAIDGLRPVTAQLWQGLCEDDRRTLPRRRRARLGRRTGTGCLPSPPAGWPTSTTPAAGPAHRHGRRRRPASRRRRRGSPSPTAPS